MIVSPGPICVEMLERRLFKAEYFDINISSPHWAHGEIVKMKFHVAAVAILGLTTLSCKLISKFSV